MDNGTQHFEKLSPFVEEEARLKRKRNLDAQNKWLSNPKNREKHNKRANQRCKDLRQTKEGVARLKTNYYNWLDKPGNKEKTRRNGRNYAKKRRQTPEGKIRQRENTLKTLYGLTVEEFNDLYTKQNGRCAICGQPKKVKGKTKKETICVDHNHKTGKVRGLLCHYCNITLGFLENNLHLLDKMLAYLGKNK